MKHILQSSFSLRKHVGHSRIALSAIFFFVCNSYRIYRYTTRNGGNECADSCLCHVYDGDSGLNVVLDDTSYNTNKSITNTQNIDKINGKHNNCREVTPLNSSATYPKDSHYVS